MEHSSLLLLSDCLFFAVTTYLECEDFGRLVSCRKGWLPERKCLIQFIWKQFLSDIWKLPISLRNISIFADVENLSFLAHMAKTMISEIRTDDRFVIVGGKSNNSATFIGSVGESNRSVQSVSPFPRLGDSTENPTIFEEMYDIFTEVANYVICNYGKGGEKFKMLESHPKQGFSTPFLVLNPLSQQRLYAAVRTVSYYEITIHKSTQLSKEEFALASQNACIAVGLATENFSKTNRLPGWDNESYGYHSDDGGIFHGRGVKLSSFGPEFGFDDIVGCGLNHTEKSIFFTLNGVLLGTPFINVRNIGLGGFNKDLYPTVGIDAPATIEFNFGADLFKFDLVDYMEKASQISAVGKCC